MPTAKIDGTVISYEIVGEGAPWVLTPGGRFSKDTPGIRDLAQSLAAHGNRVLIWDRPNTGGSDVCFTGSSESAMQADYLAGLLRTLDMAPAFIFGGSGGARVSLLTAAHHPDVAAGLAMVWISGGVYGLMLLATHYCGESIRVAWRGGMEAVVELPEWSEVLERNPRNRDRFLSLESRQFIETLERWMLAYCPDPSSAVPGLPDAECAGRSTRTTPAPRRSGSTSSSPALAWSSRRGATTSGTSAATQPGTARATCSSVGRCSRPNSSTSRHR